MGRAKKNRLLRELSEPILKGRAFQAWRLHRACSTELNAYLRTQGASLDEAIEGAYGVIAHLGHFIEYLIAIQKKRSLKQLEMLKET